MPENIEIAKEFQARINACWAPSMLDSVLSANLAFLYKNSYFPILEERGFKSFGLCLAKKDGQDRSSLLVVCDDTILFEGKEVSCRSRSIEGLFSAAGEEVERVKKAKIAQGGFCTNV